VCVISHPGWGIMGNGVLEKWSVLMRSALWWFSGALQLVIVTVLLVSKMWGFSSWAFFLFCSHNDKNTPVTHSVLQSAQCSPNLMNNIPWIIPLAITHFSPRISRLVYFCDTLLKINILHLSSLPIPIISIHSCAKDS